MSFKYAMQVSLHVKTRRGILKFNLRGPALILAHNKKTQYAWISHEKETNLLRFLP